MVSIGVMGGAGHYTLIKAYSMSRAATLSPFTYTNFLWAIAFGFVVFGDIPDLWTMIGAAIIFGSGLYIFHREEMLKKRPPSTFP